MVSEISGFISLIYYICHIDVDPSCIVLKRSATSMDIYVVHHLIVYIVHYAIIYAEPHLITYTKSDRNK